MRALDDVADLAHRAVAGIIDGASVWHTAGMNTSNERSNLLRFIAFLLVPAIELLVVLQDQLHTIRTVNHAEIVLVARETTRLLANVA